MLVRISRQIPGAPYSGFYEHYNVVEGWVQYASSATLMEPLVAKRMAELLKIVEQAPEFEYYLEGKEKV